MYRNYEDKMLNDIFMNNQASDINNDLEKTYVGYIKGNLFKNLYDGYKNYKPVELIPNSEQAEMLLNINQMEFASHELRLLLDVYPDNMMIINKFNEYRSKANELMDMYEKKYGPLCWSDLSNMNMFSWEVSSWPWEMEEK